MRLVRLDPERRSTKGTLVTSSTPKAQLARYPELAAGGFTHDNHRVIFYSRVRAILPAEAKVLDFGAGRGRSSEEFSDHAFLLDLIDLRTAGAHVMGCDVDPVVLENPMLDEATVISADGPLPYPDNEFDLVVSWAVLEHVQEADVWAKELARVVKPGGWICAWTPNKWGMVGVGARIVPNRYHVAVLHKVLKKTARGEEDIFPTVYRMNTRRTLRRLFRPEAFLHATYAFSGPIGYVDRSRLAILVAKIYRALPGGVTASYLHIFIQKRPDQNVSAT
jgi:SAM-dependent methyltransferase